MATTKKKTVKRRNPTPPPPRQAGDKPVGVRIGAGRPLIFETPDDLKKVVDKYFGNCKPKNDYGQYPTMSGLAFALRVNRETLVNYSKRGGEYEEILGRAKQQVEMALEQHLYDGPVAGVKFSLINNFGWTDATIQQIEQTTRVVTIDPDDEPV